MSHNKALNALLEKLNELVGRAKKEEDFKPVFDECKKFIRNSGQEIKFDHKNKILASLLSLIPGTIFSFIFFTNQKLQYQLDIWAFVIFGAILAWLIIPLCMLVASNSKISEISDWIYEKDVMFDNGLTEKNVENRGDELYHELNESFGEFRGRGDEDRNIKQLVSGHHQGEEAEFDFEYYKFHYVEVYYVPVPRKVGKTTIIVMERRTRDCYRYGLMSDFKHTAGIALRSSGGSYNYPSNWKTASENFNNIFSVSAINEMTASKFLNPSIILACEDINKYFSGLNIEINREGRLNIAFGDSDILDTKKSRQYSIASPIEFEKEINSFLALPKLNKLLVFLETLHKYSDSNF